MRIAVALAVLALAGCANPYADHYKGVGDARTLPQYEAGEQGVRLYSSTDLDRDRLALMRQGYVYIGQAAFTARSNAGDVAQAKAQAEKVGAHAVLTTSQYSHTENRVIPLVLPNTTNSYTRGSATAYGPGGTVNAYGSSTTTTYGTRTTFLPSSVAHSQFAAVYFAKARFRVGVHVADLEPATRRRIGSNAGVFVEEVVEGTDAFFNDVLPGDVITEVGEETVFSVASFNAALKQYEGRKVAVAINRGGEMIGKKLEVTSLAQP